jgi:flagellar motor protein MotB
MSRSRSRSLISARISRSSEGSWAVSYADFLMVLLSFFIVFFSINDQSPLHFIIKDLEKLSGGKSGTSNSTGTESAPNISEKPSVPGQGQETSERQTPVRTLVTGQPSDVLDRLAGILPNSILTEQRKVKQLTINLRNDIYGVGKFEIPASELEPVISELRAYQGHLGITVLGHSDPIAFAVNGKSLARDNTTLSSVRAAYAATYLQSRLPQAKVWTQAQYDDSRQTRSLSIILEERVP